MYACEAKEGGKERRAQECAFSMEIPNDGLRHVFESASLFFHLHPLPHPDPLLGSSGHQEHTTYPPLSLLPVTSASFNRDHLCTTWHNLAQLFKQEKTFTPPRTPPDDPL